MIVDCTMALAGPFGTALLADMGADVIKIEPPHGDGARTVGPLPPDYANPGTEPPAGVDFGGYFASINRNKRSVVLDLKQDDDRETLLLLCEQADAIVENMRVGVMDRLGVGYEVIRKRNPRIVYAHWVVRDRRTARARMRLARYAFVAQSMGGLVGYRARNGGGLSLGCECRRHLPGTLLAMGAGRGRTAPAPGGAVLLSGMYDAVLASRTYGELRLQPGRTSPAAASSELAPFGITRQGRQRAIARPGPAHWRILCEAMSAKELIDDRDQQSFVRSDNVELVRRRLRVTRFVPSTNHG